jgi:hypothetical protein
VQEKMRAAHGRLHLCLTYVRMMTFLAIGCDAPAY